MNWIEIGFLATGVILGATVFKKALPAVHQLGLKIRFWLRHGRKGKRILLVYSDSSIWKDYIEANILPRIESYSIILNWSKRREWGSRVQIEAKLIEHWIGPGQFLPVAILFSVLGRARTFRLWELSGNAQNGKARVSKEAEQALFETVKRLPPAG